MANQVMIYEVKVDAASNAEILFSDDGKRFYWNDLKFKRLNPGDYVFVVNTHGNFVLFSKINDQRIETTLDTENLVSHFTADNKQFEPKAPTKQKLEQWKNFICLEILEKKAVQNDWNWATLGSSENTYLSDETSDKNRIKRTAILIELFEDSEDAKAELNECYRRQFKLNHLKDLDWFHERQNSSEFYFSKAQGILREFKEYSLDDQQYDSIFDSFKNRGSTDGHKLKYRDVVDSIEDDTVKEFALCLGKLITYLDTKADNKYYWNEYNPPRSIARAGIWMGNWIKNLIQYKKDGNRFEKLAPGITNAIKYLEDPINNAPIVSESHKDQIIRNFSQSNYNPETFTHDLKEIFKPGDLISELNVQNDQSLTLLLINILYMDEIQVAWTDYLSGFYYNDNRFETNQIVQQIHQNNFAEHVFSSVPKGGKDTIQDLSKKLEGNNSYISVVIERDDMFDVLYANDFYTVKESEGSLLEDGNKRNEPDISESFPNEFVDKFKLKFVHHTTISKENLELEDFTFIKPLKQSGKPNLTPFVSPDLDDYMSIQPIYKSAQPIRDRVKDIEKEDVKKTIDSNNMINQVFHYIKSKGFKFTVEEIANFYLCLKTKPFVILAGISGTGKTKLPRLFAEAVGMKEEQVTQVPVGPDWTDASDLIGYTSLNGQFISKPLTDIILKANEQKNKPFFFILDEMNLARVEHYFADFLSVIETRRRRTNDSDEIITDALITESQIKDAANKEKYEGLFWPENLYLIGTVNMDETTHPFSRKVLDRANSIEMNTVELGWIEDDKDNVEPLASFSNALLRGAFIGSVNLTAADKISVKNDLAFLVEINAILKGADLHFAYRVRDEIIFYLLYARKENLLKATDAMDFQLMQKILPRIHGSSMRTQKVLVGLINKISEVKYSQDNPDMTDINNKKDSLVSVCPYPRSLEKLIFMLERFDEDRFTSFWV